MARFVVPVVVLVALVGGYVVGQQPEPGPSNLANAGQVGRYAPAGDGRMLDTASGTLYEAHEHGWKVVASLSDTVATVIPAQAVAFESEAHRQRLEVFSKLSRQRDDAFDTAWRLVEKIREQPSNEQPSDEEVQQQLKMNRLIVETVDELLDSDLPKRHPPKDDE